MVCLGAHFSAIWIVVANSWQQTPAGHHWEVAGRDFPANYRIPAEKIFESRAVIDDFWAMVFNPSSMDRLGHTILGCYLAGATLVMSVAAYYLLKRKHTDFAKASLKIALPVMAIVSLVQIYSGHRSSEIVAEHQPSKLAAMEGLWETQENAPLTIVGWVDGKNEKTYGLKIPGMLSWLAHGDTQAEVTGLDAFAKEDRPNVAYVFQFFHVMVGIGFLLMLIAGIGVFMWWRGKLFDVDNKWTRVFLWVVVFTVLLPQVANQIGWFTAEMGRQPWIVWEQLRTSQGLSQVVEAEAVLFSLIGFTVIYTLLFALFIFMLNQKIQHGPTPYADAADHIPTMWKQTEAIAEGRAETDPKKRGPEEKDKG
jgi:cytochrome d ubiquinol oxidase subunit I